MTTERRYAELHAHSAFTFLDGTDEPARMVEEAARLGLDALAILDVDGMYSTVQTTMAARTVGLPIVYGAELTLAPDALRSIIPGSSAPGWGLAPGAEDPGMRLPIVAASPTGYAHLVGAMSDRALSEPGQRNPRHDLVNLSEAGGELVVLTGGRRGPLMRALRAGGAAPARRVLDGLVDAFGRDQVLVEWQAARGDEDEVGDVLAELARASGTRLVATSGARMSSPSKQALGDILTATRLGSSLDEAEAHLGAHRSFLRSPAEMARLHGAHPQALDNACEVASACAFDLRLVAPRLPRTQVPDGHTPDSWLAHCTYEGASVRYGSRAHHPRAWETIEHELGVIERLGFAGYFLIVKEIVDFCARNGILCQGRGSAANSAVCYCLGITAVDAVRHNLLFERFLSDARSGPPDIDVDIEACRREEVIQYVYDTFGRDRAAQVANVITYRPRSAIRDVARALGYPAGTATAWSQGRGAVPPLVRDAAQALARLPRHMGIHSGGMVLTDQPVSRICPVGWAAMPGRTVLQWDKEDCTDAGLVKFDLLSLGMLTALRVAFEELQAGGARAGAALNQLRGWAPRVVQGREGQPLGLHTLPEEDPRVYDLLCAADTVGVFQVESRAQMNTLPRLKPRCFYDIVVEVALIRPGPIQGRSVNPYLRRRSGREEVTYLHPLLEPALRQTLGVPLFQEQLMRIATDAAGLSGARADQLRRAMGAKRSPERMEALKGDLMAGMEERGIDAPTRERIFEQLKGFADFGFPESHSFSFAHIVYASSWLKVHAPEHFYAAILASQPMGFYSPATLVQDARRHGVRVVGPSVNDSLVDASVQRVGENEAGESYNPGRPEALPSRGTVALDVDRELAVRIGLSQVRGLGAAAERIVDARRQGAFTSQADLARRAHVSASAMEKLAMAGALECLGVGRREGAWAAGALAQPQARAGQWQPFLPGTEVGSRVPELPSLSEVERMCSDVASTGLTPGRHPFSYVRGSLPTSVLRAGELSQYLAGRIVDIAGVVTHRQRPHTGGGITFLSLEDETGFVNVSVSVGAWKKFRRVCLESNALLVRGTLEWGDGAINVQAFQIAPVDLPIDVRSRDFR
ncbi:MAG: error-prone DNA polymerase [Actinomyces sp.]|nr:error-prone DNA polymerase [Actinomyces sp.]